MLSKINLPCPSLQAPQRPLTLALSLPLWHLGEEAGSREPANTPTGFWSALSAGGGRPPGSMTPRPLTLRPKEADRVGQKLHGGRETRPKDSVPSRLWRPGQGVRLRAVPCVRCLFLLPTSPTYKSRSAQP